MKICELWKRLTTTRHARRLEAEFARLRSENQRLRAENRGLLNSILGIAGVPPLPATAEDLAVVKNGTQEIPTAASSIATRDDHAQKHRTRVGTSHRVAPSAGSSPHVAVPMRKRSWQQINRMLEFESAQKDKPVIDALANRRI